MTQFAALEVAQRSAHLKHRRDGGTTAVELIQDLAVDFAQGSGNHLVELSLEGGVNEER